MRSSRMNRLLGIELPIIQAPMAGASGAAMAVAVSEAGGLGSLPCALLGPEQIRAHVTAIRAETRRPINLNFFCHAPPANTDDRRWRVRLLPYFQELAGASVAPLAPRRPFDEVGCALVEELRPEVISFHFGLPEPSLLARVRATGAKIVSSATTVAEARWLDERGCDAIIAQGAEAGGHRATFLGSEPNAQVGTMALVPQVVDAVKAPVIAAGGIADARGIVAAFALGASAVQLGTAYLFCPEAKISAPYRHALRAATDDSTTLTNVHSGRPARGIVNRLVREVGPLSDDVPPFPLASNAIAPLRAQAEASGSSDFSPLWAGQAAPLHRTLSAAELTRALASEASALISALTR